MKKRIFPVLLILCLLLCSLSASVYATDEEEYTATITEAYGGAKGIVSMTFDDGYYETAVWLDEMFEKYDLYGSTMMIVRTNFEMATTDEDGNTVYVEDTAATQKWKELFSNGRLSPESHTYTHIPLPSTSWTKYETYKDNNTEENYQTQLVLSKELLEEYMGTDALCLAPSNNTLSDGAMAVVMENYYAVRQGSRFSASTYSDIQSLDPVVGSAEKGGWYNLMMLGFSDGSHAGITTYLPAAMEYAAKNGGWIVTMCHKIGESTGDAYYSEAEPTFALMGEYVKEGTLWVTTFGDATRYIRERQNSTVSYTCTADGIAVRVTMASETEDGLSLDADVFNHPLTVKVELPGGVEAVKYQLDGQTCSAQTFTEDGATYAYVNVIPNSAEVALTPVSAGGIYSASDLAAALDSDGEYKLMYNISLDGTVDLNAAATNAVIDLNGKVVTFTGKNTVVVAEGASVTFKNGNVVVAYSYKSGTKSFGKYKPVVENDDGTFSLGSATAIDTDAFAEEDLLRTYSAPAFSVTGGTLVLDGVGVERRVAVSNDSYLLSASAGGELTLKECEIYSSVGAEAWANASTQLIRLARASTPTKLTITESYVREATPNNCYGGVYYSADGPSAINTATGEVTGVGNTVDSGDNILICKITGTTENTGVTIVIDNSDILSQHRGFLSDSLTSSSDTLTMTNSRMKVVRNSNYKERSFEFMSAALVFENCYMELSNNGIVLNNSSNTGSTSLTMRQCFVKGSHVIASASNRNDILFEDTYLEGGMLRWIGYAEENAMTLPQIKISGTFYTSSNVSDTVPVYNVTDGFTSTTKNYWFNFVKTNESDTVSTSIPAWYATVRHTDGTTDILSTDTCATSAADGDVIYLWNAYADDTKDPLAMQATGSIYVRSDGLLCHLALVGEHTLSVTDGNVGAASLLTSDGTHKYYINDTARTAYVLLSDAQSGDTIVLQSDHSATKSFYTGAKKLAVDLNGYTVYHPTGEVRLQPMFGTESDDDALYIYSSRAGARLMNGHTVKVDGTATTDQAGIIFYAEGGVLAVGYGLDGEARGERIDLIGGQILSMYRGTFLANDTAWYNVSGDNSTVISVYKNRDDGRTLTVSNSDVYVSYHSTLVLYRDVTTDTANVTFENSNIYTKRTNRVLVKEHAAGTLETAQTLVLRNTNVYGLVMSATDMMRVVVEGECRLPSVPEGYVTLGVGYGGVAQSGTVALDGTSYPQYSLYGGAELTGFDASYSYGCVVGAASDYKRSVYTNVSLDTALDLNLYFPVDTRLQSVLVDGVEMLNTDLTKTIDGSEYYVVTVSKVPSEAYEESVIDAVYKDGDTLVATYKLVHSLVNYANLLLSMKEENYTGDTLTYLQDSKQIMRYALYYVRAAIEKYGAPEDAELAISPFDALLSDFALSEDDRTLSDVKTELPTGTGTAAAFDLDTYVGFVLTVYNTFTGNVTVSVGERTESASFTSYESESTEVADYVVVSGIAAHELYEAPITITIVGQNGEDAVDVTFEYNLATYVAGGVSGELGEALFAYAKAAESYYYDHTVATIR